MRGNGTKEGRREDWHEAAEEFLPSSFLRNRVLKKHKEQIILQPEMWNGSEGLRVLQSGLIVGTWKRQFEPSPQLALALSKEEYGAVLDLPVDDIRTDKYLKGETITAEEKMRGWVLVCAGGYPLGWCKGNGQGMYKNKYHAGWRKV